MESYLSFAVCSWEQSEANVESYVRLSVELIVLTFNTLLNAIFLKA